MTTGIKFAKFRLELLTVGLRNRLIVLLGGYEQDAVSHLVYASRRASQQLDGDESSIGFAVNRKLKGAIARVDPEAGRRYGYDRR